MVETIERPAHSGVYPIVDAVALIKATCPEDAYLVREVTTRHCFRWVRDGLTGQYLTGLRGEDVALTFLDLVSLS